MDVDSKRKTCQESYNFMRKNIPDELKLRVLSMCDSRERRNISDEECNSSVSSILSERLEDLQSFLNPVEKNACVFVANEFLEDHESAHAAYNEIIELKMTNCFEPSSVRINGISTSDSSARDDTVVWLRNIELKKYKNIMKILNKFEHLRMDLNTEVRKAGYNYELVTSELQLSCYSGGSFGYVRHKDSCEANFRFITAIMYLNIDWKKEDCGCLRLVLKNNLVDIPPLLNRFVMFRSDQVEHEVLPSYADRYAITCWISFFDKKENGKEN